MEELVATQQIDGHWCADRCAEDEATPFAYALGCRMRRQKEVNEEVLSRAGRYQTVRDNLEVKEVLVQDRRHIVCRNPIEARKDKTAREALVAKLERIIAKEDFNVAYWKMRVNRFLNWLLQ